MGWVLKRALGFGAAGFGYEGSVTSVTGPSCFQEAAHKELGYNLVTFIRFKLLASRILSVGWPWLDSLWLSFYWLDLATGWKSLGEKSGNLMPPPGVSPEQNTIKPT